VVNSFSSKGKRLFHSSVPKWLNREPHHPDSFQCGVRVVEGQIGGEGRRWKYRQSAVDRLIVDQVVTLTHGVGHVLRLRVAAEWAPHPDQAGLRVSYAVFRAVEQTSGAMLEITVSQDDLERFGIGLT
jgi:hypothetical protein